MASSNIAEFPSEDCARSAGRPDASPLAGALDERTSARVEWAVVGAVLVVATALRLGPIQRGLGFDELFTAIHFVQTDTIWQTATTWLNLNNHVAFSLLARLSV